MQKQNPVIKNYILSTKKYMLNSEEKNNNKNVYKDFESYKNINLLLLFSMLH